MFRLAGPFTWFFLLIALIFSSCANRKKIVYFQGENVTTDTLRQRSPLLKTDDLLSITVMGIDAEAVKPFNLLTYGSFSGGDANSNQAQSLLPGYLIDLKGEIDFPVIGKIKVSGLNRTEAAEIVTNKLKDYLKNPIVNIRILNFKITILGDVTHPGIFTIPNDRVTIIEALGMAGDLNLSAKRKNVLVIRDADGKRTETRVDLTNNSIFNSPVYYLQQNDVIYVEHNRAKKNSAVVNIATISVFVTLTSIFITLAALLTR